MSSDWQPIDSAPRDGTRFLAAHQSGILTALEVTGSRTRYDSPDEIDWYCMAVAYRCGAQCLLSEFIGWMPLPSPPDPTP